MVGVSLAFMGLLLILGLVLFILMRRLRREAVENPLDSIIKEKWFKEEEEYLKAMTMCSIMCDGIYYYPWWLYHSEKCF